MLLSKNVKIGRNATIYWDQVAESRISLRFLDTFKAQR